MPCTSQRIRRALKNIAVVDGPRHPVSIQCALMHNEKSPRFTARSVGLDGEDYTPHFRSTTLFPVLNAVEHGTDLVFSLGLGHVPQKKQEAQRKNQKQKWQL